MLARALRTGQSRIAQWGQCVSFCCAQMVRASRHRFGRSVQCLGWIATLAAERGALQDCRSPRGCSSQSSCGPNEPAGTVS
eukprot:15479247-Alexandrium_andersonii.AAC.1